MPSEKPAWVPNRAALKRRIERGLESSTAAGSRAGDTATAPTKAAAASGAARALSTRIDRLAVEQFRGLASLQTEVNELRRAIEESGVAPGSRSGAVEVCEIGDILIGIPAEEWRLVAYFRYRGAPEPGALSCFRSLAKPGMCVADVGANVGLFTIAAAIEIGAEGKVFAFEPTPRTRAVLEQNIQLNGLLESGRVAVSGFALSDTAGTAHFGVYGADGGRNSLYAPDGVDQVIEVQTLPLDEAVPDVALDLVKIDAEGAEPAVLRGMRGHIARNRQIKIIAELAPALLRRAGADPGAFLRQIEELGLQHRLIAEPGGAAVEFPAERLLELESANLLLSRKASA